MPVIDPCEPPLYLSNTHTYTHTPATDIHAKLPWLFFFLFILIIASTNSLQSNFFPKILSHYHWSAVSFQTVVMSLFPLYVCFLPSSFLLYCFHFSLCVCVCARSRKARWRRSNISAASVQRSAQHHPNNSSHVFSLDITDSSFKIRVFKTNDE